MLPLLLNRHVLFGIAFSLLFAWGAYNRFQYNGERDKNAMLEAAAKVALAQAKQKEAEYIANKEKADHENTVARANLVATIKRLRDERPGGVIPEAPSSSSRPDLACFDRAEYQRAYGEFIAEIRGLADEGSTCAVDLDAAKRWAQSLR